MSRAVQRVRALLAHVTGSARAATGTPGSDDEGAAAAAAAAEDELDSYIRAAEQSYQRAAPVALDASSGSAARAAQPADDAAASVLPQRRASLPFLMVPSFVEEAAKSNLDVSQDDSATPLAFRLIRIILLTAEARRAQDIHLDQVADDCMSVVFTTQLGATSPLLIRGAVVRDVITYLAHYEHLTTGKPLPGPMHDYKIAIKVRTNDFLKGTHNVYRVNSIRTNHDLGYFHIVMRVLQN